VLVKLLGSLVVNTGTGETTLSGARQRTALAFLALNARSVVSADRLIEELWGDDPPSDPMNSLQSQISQLRRVLGPDRVVKQGTGYLLDIEPDAVDALRFERLVTAARGPSESASTAADALREGLALWRGAPLADIGDAPFARAEASRLEELRMAAVEDRIDADLAQGLHSSLVGELRTLVAQAPLRERLHGQLMLALYRSGRQAEALRAYDSARKLLTEELGLSPGPELRRLEAAILAQDEALTAAVRAPPAPEGLTAVRATAPHGLRVPLAAAYGPGEPCVGRGGDLARLAERWEHTHAGNQHAIFIVGEPGIGKTRLTAEFARRVAAEGAVVLFGRCDEDVLSPFQPFVEAVRDLVDRLDDAELTGLLGTVGPHLAQLVPGLATRIGQAAVARPDEPSMLWFVDALASLLAALATTAPVLLILDDVHWADSTTVAGLRHVMRRNRASATFIIGTYRASELHETHPLLELLADLRSDRSCERLALKGLDEPAIAELLAADVPDTDLRSLAASRVREETEGNPLFIGELLRHLADERSAPLAEQLLALGKGAVPEGITELIGRRLRRVSETCRTVLRLSAVLGVVFPTTVLRALAGSAGADVLSALDEAEAAGIVREDPDTDPPSYAFTHTLVRRTLYDGTSRVRRQELHAAAARAIISTIGVNDRTLPVLASHFRLAGTAADPVEAADVLLAAAALVSRGWAKAEAAELYAAALELLPESDTERRRDATLQRSVNLQAAWHARFDQPSIRATSGISAAQDQDA